MNNANAASATPIAAQALRLPTQPLRFGVRLMVASLALLWFANAFSIELVDHLLPAVRAEVTALYDNISVISLDLVQDGPSNMVRLRANLVRPIYIKQYVVYPRGWLPHTAGGYQVYLNTRGVLQSSLILLIVVLSWPHRSSRDLSMRLGLALPFAAVLIAIDAPLELLGNFQHEVLHEVDRQGFHALFAWDKFLEGGGNDVLALAFAALAIVLATPASARTAPLPQAATLS